MSSQSGISASEALRTQFKVFAETGNRALLVKIENESLEPYKLIKGTSDFEEDWSLINKEFSNAENDPAYIVVKQDALEAENFIFISYVPDKSAVRSKMIYASTKNTLVNTIGSNSFKNYLFLTDKREISKEGWLQYLKHENLPNPLTKEELSLKEIEMSEHEATFISSTATKQKLVNINGQSNELIFEISDELSIELSSFQEASKGSLINCEISLEKEIITLNESFSNVELSEFSSKLNYPGKPQYSIYKYSDSQSAFIYTCPSSSKVKERMIYASNKLGFIHFLTKSFNVSFSKIVEIGDIDELNLNDFETQSNDDPDTSKNLRFSKPKGPRRR